MASTAGRRKSNGGHTTTQGVTTAALAGGTSKRPNSLHRNRIDSSLMMSTNTRKSTDDVKNLATTGARGNKSSDRLHRIAGGSSSTNLSQHKRSKSHSQLMSAGTGGKKKKKEQRDEDEDGWTSSSQKGTPEQSGSPNSDSGGDEDEGLVMRAKTKEVKATQKEKEKEEYIEPVNGTTPRGPLAKTKEDMKNPLTRTDTQITLRGFQTATSPNTLSFPTQTSQAESQRQDSEGKDSTTRSQTGSDDTLAQDAITPDPEQYEEIRPALTAEKRPSFDRNMSATSAKTLMADEPYEHTSSPISLKSKATSRTSLFPRETQRAAAPKLSTQYALAGALGSLQEDSEMEQMMMRRRHLSEAGITSSRSENTHLRDQSDESYTTRNFGSTSSRRKSSISSIRSNMINVPSASPSMADISLGAARAEHSQQGSGPSALDAMFRASNSSFQITPNRGQYDRRRTTSTQSLSASDAATLATKLRMARGESFDEAHTTSASKLLASSNSKYFTVSNRSDLASTKAMKEYNKPTISVFVKRMGERKNIEVKVDEGSLFDDNFSRATLSGKREGGKQVDDDVDEEDDEEEEEEEEEDDSPRVRYVMDFGLSGPAVHKTPTTEALLSTLLDHDEFEATWAPALANAAGLGEGTRRAREAARDGGGMDSLQLNGLSSTGGVAINGPNATPMHFLHGLTNTTDAPFPLEPSDMATNPNNPAPAAVLDGGEYLDAKNLRAIAMTWTALNVNKSHVVTRRYVDPMRESLERVARASGLLGTKKTSGGSHTHGQYHPNLTPGSGSTTPGGSLRWSGWRNLFSEHHTLQEEAGESR